MPDRHTWTQEYMALQTIGDIGPQYVQVGWRCKFCDARATDPDDIEYQSILDSVIDELERENYA